MSSIDDLRKLVEDQRASVDLKEAQESAALLARAPIDARRDFEEFWQHAIRWAIKTGRTNVDMMDMDSYCGEILPWLGWAPSWFTYAKNRGFDRSVHELKGAVKDYQSKHTEELQKITGADV